MKGIEAMKTVANAISRAMSDRKGVTALEYTILAVAIILVITAATTGLAAPITTAWEDIVAALGG